MDALNDMASGAAGIVTALGMGTVFVCLILLYLMTHLLGWLMSAASRPADGRSSGGEQGASDDGASNETSAHDNPGDDHQAIAAAVTLALARHRAARVRPAETAGGGDPWKVAGRLAMLR